ncbi:MAG: Ig-like domain-containing protein [Acidobacteriota bacterium]
MVSIARIPQPISCLALALVSCLVLAAPVLAQPTFQDLQPADGTLLAAPTGTLTGILTDTVAGAAQLTIDGVEVPLGAGGAFSYAYDLAEGPSTLQLWASDGATPTPVTAEATLTLTVDTTAPAFAVTTPTTPVVGASPTTVAGTVQEPHLDTITVATGPQSVAASTGNGSFSASLPLVEGPQTVTVTAVDTLGHQTTQSLHLVLDTIAPQIVIADGGQPFAGGVVGRPVAPVVTVNDATATSVEILLDGAPFASGDTVSAEGAHTLAVTATDAGGHQSTASVAFTIDTTPPTLGAIAPLAGTVLAATPTALTVEATGATSIDVAGPAGSASASGSSPFSVGPLALAEGDNDLSITATDPAGNPTARTHRLVLDTTAPALAIEAPADGDVVATSTIPVAGTAEDARLASVTVNGMTANLVGTTWSVDALALTAGANALTVVATDAVGHQTTRTVTVTLDAAAPTIEVLVDGAPLVSGSVFAGPVTPTITVDDPGATIVSTLDGAAWTSGTEVSAAGTHELAVTATSAGGVSASTLRVFTIDPDGPSILTVEPADGHVQTASEVTLIGTLSSTVALTVNGTPAAVFADGFRASPLALTEGATVFTLEATSRSGLTSTRQHTIVRDTTAPTLAVTSPAEGALRAEPTVQVSGTATDPHLARVTVAGIEAQRSGSTWLAAVPLEDGAATLTVRAEDAVGNAATTTHGLIVDTTAPSVAITDPAPGSIVPDATYTVSGTTEDPHLERVEVRVGAGAPHAATVTGSTWSVDVPLAAGANTLTARAVDRAGHAAEASVSLLRDADAPSIEILVPAEGEATTAATLEVRGVVIDAPPNQGNAGQVEDGVTVTVNGLVAVVEQGTWTVAAVPLAEGTNRLTARATDAQGNEGVHTREIVRDLTPPELVSSRPTAGALALPLETVFRLTFSEELATPAPGSWSLTSGAMPVPGTILTDGPDLVLTPDAPLPADADLTLTLSAQLTDRAGNALDPVPAPLIFHTVAVDAPSAPTVNSTPQAWLCAPTVTLDGTAPADLLVRATGGAARAEVRTDEVGVWSLEIALLPDQPNRLELVAVDLRGGGEVASTPVVIDLVHDCTPPSVAAATLDGQTLTITFDEEIDSATLEPALVLTDASGTLGPPADFTASVATTDGVSVATAAFATAPSVPLALEVKTIVTDRAGNSLAYPSRHVFGAAGGDSFLAGLAVDDATGRPLPGAIAQVTATGGTPLADPVPQHTAGTDGRLLLALPAGTHDLTIARTGYAPAFRIVTTSAGEGTQIFDPRLTPLAPSMSVGTGGGTVFSDTESGASGAGDSPATLTVPAGGVAASATMSLTTLGEQALPALLPYGWSPRGAVWLESTEDLTTPASLTLPVDAPDGTLLPIVTLDLATLQWTVLVEVTVTGGSVTSGNITTTITDVGAFAAVEADPGANAPPAPTVGQPLGSSTAPLGDEVAAATITFAPETILATQRAEATVTYTLDDLDAPSGLPLTLVVEEELTLLDGSLRRQAPYQTDLVLYRDPAGAPRSRFWLAPSDAARATTVRSGGEDVTVRAYGEETVRGDVLGPDGGAVTSAEGDQVTLPAGALAGPTAVVLQRGDVLDLPIAPPAAHAVAAVLTLDLADQHLAAPASLDIALTTPPAPTAEGLLLHRVEVEDTSGASVPAWRAVAALAPTATGWSTTAVDAAPASATTPWPGVRSGGSYVALELSSPHALLRGIARAADGVTKVPGTVLTSPSVEWLQIASEDPAGAYVLPLPVSGSDHTVTARDPASGNAQTLTVPAATADPIDLDTVLQVVGPWVAEITPADGAVDVLTGIQPTVRFSEPVERTSLDGQIELLRTDTQEPVALTLDHQGDLVRLEPASSLAPGTSFTLRVGASLRDLDGYLHGATITTTFTTEAAVVPAGVDPLKIRLLTPVGGLATVRGLPGAVPGDALTVSVENVTSFTTTESVTPDVDGSFELTVGASLDDELRLRVVLSGATTGEIILGPFLSADERSARLRPDGAAGSAIGSPEARWITADGYELAADAGTFTAPTWVRAEPVDPSTLSLQPPQDATALMAFNVTFDGAAPRKPLRVRLPSAGADPAATHLLVRQIEALGRRGWMQHDRLRLEGGELTNEPLAASSGASSASTVASPAKSSQSTVFAVPARHLAQSAKAAQLAASGVHPIAQDPHAQIAIFWTDTVPTKEDSAHDVLLQSSTSSAAAAAAGTLPTKSLLGDALGLFASGLYAVFEIAQPVACVGAGLPPGLAAANVAVDPPYLAVVTAFEHDIVGITSVCLPAVYGAPLEVQVEDLTTGHVLYREVLPAPDAPFFPLGADVFGDGEPPVPLEGSPAAVHLLRAASPGPIARGLSSERVSAGGNDVLRVSGTAGVAAPGATIHLLSLDGTGDATTTADAQGAFTVTSGAVAATHRFVLTVGAVLDPADEQTLRFQEILDLDQTVVTLHELDDAGTLGALLDASPRLTGGGTTLAVRPRAGWRAGRYRLTVEATDVADLRQRPIFLDLRVARSASVGQIDLPFFQDAARLGSLLFVAAGPDGLRIVDLTHPRVPLAWPGGAVGASPALPLPLSGAVRGVVVDAHGRVVYAGGGEQSFGTVRLLDPLAVDPTLAVDPASAQAQLDGAVLGSTILTDPVGGATQTQLPAGLPRRVAVVGWDVVDTLTAGTPVPAALAAEVALAPTVIPGRGDAPLTVAGTVDASLAGVPVTVRNTTRGRLARTVVASDGSWSLTLDARRGDQLELRRNVRSAAYVASEGVGLGVVNLAALDETTTDPAAATQIVGFQAPILPPSGEVCDPSRPIQTGQPTDLATLTSSNAGQPLLVALLRTYGFVLLEPSVDAPASLTARGWGCGAVGADQRAVLTGVDAAAGVPIVDSDSGEVTEADLVLLAHAEGHLLVFDVTDPSAPQDLAWIDLGVPAASDVTFDPVSRRAYVTAYGAGLVVVDLTDLSRSLDGYGTSDRVVDTLPLPDDEALDAVVHPGLGLTAVGGRQRGLTTVATHGPQLRLLGDDGVSTTVSSVAAPVREVGQIAPFGVPTDDQDGSIAPHPGSVRLEVALPGLAASAAEAAAGGTPTLTVDVRSETPGGGLIDGAGDTTPPTSRTVTLTRQAMNAYEDGQHLYQSEPIVLLADLRASIAFTRSTTEDTVCTRCDQVAEGVYDALPLPANRLDEMLSGHLLVSRFTEDLTAPLQGIYGEIPAATAALRTPSVPWDLSPSTRQEPAINPSLGSGDAVGVLLHSGELTVSDVDLVLPAVGFDLAFQRTYRSQTLGAGPLGPGWDHAYRLRLRPLPNGDVELFDGTGRREVFQADPSRVRGRLRAPAGVFSSLTRTGSGYTLVDRSGRIARFDTWGRLMILADEWSAAAQQGNEVRFAYDEAGRLDRVEHHGPDGPTQTSFTFEYDAAGRLQTVEDSTDRAIGFSFDADGRLIASRLPEVELSQGGATATPTTTYIYGPVTGTLAQRLHQRDELTAINDAESTTWLEITHSGGEPATRAVTAQIWGGDALSITYTDTGSALVASVTDRRGFKRRYVHNASGHLTRFEDVVLTGAQGESLEAITTWQYGAHPNHGLEAGLPTAVTGPTGVTRRMTYVDANPDGGEQVPDVTLANLTRLEILPGPGLNGSDDPLDFDAACRRPLGINGTPLGALVWEFSEFHDRSQSPLRIQGPAAQESTVTPFDDSVGVPAATREDITDGSDTTQSAETKLSYDEFGRTMSVTVHSSSADQTVDLEYTGDAPFPTRTLADPTNERIETLFEYDERGNPIRIVEPGNLERTAVYNVLGWPLETCWRLEGAPPVCTTLRYDALGRLVESREPYGPEGQNTLTTTIAYGTLGEVLSIETAAGDDTLIETRTYDAQRNLHSVDAPTLTPVTYAYDGRNRPIEVTTIDGTARWTYSASDQVTTYTDPAGHSWSTLYDRYDRSMRQVDPLGHFTQTSYDDGSRLAKTTACSVGGDHLASNETKYDSAGRPIKQIAHKFGHGEPLELLSTRMEYDEASQLIQVVDPLGRSVDRTYDALGRVGTESVHHTVGGASSIRRSMDYDVRGNVTKLTVTPKALAFDANPVSFTTTFVHDALDRLVAEMPGEDPNQRITYAYDVRGNIVRTTAPEGASTRATYDAYDRPVLITEPNSLEVEYTYTDGADDAVVAFRDAHGNATTWAYDGLGRLISQTDPLGQLESYVYTAAGDLALRTLRNGDSELFDYDPLGRLTERTLDTTLNIPTTTSWTRDALGRVVLSSHDQSTLRWSYDSIGQATSEEQVLSGVSRTLGFTHDAGGQRASMLYPSQLGLAMTSTALGQLATIADGADPLAAYQYLGHLTAQRQAGPFEGKNTFDPSGRLVDARTAAGGHVLAHESIARTHRGFAQSTNRWDLAGAGWAYTYDEAGRLTRVEADGADWPGLADSFHYTVDEAQNLTSMVSTGTISACGGATSTTSTIELGPGNRPTKLTTDGAETVLTFDARGNLIAKGDLRFTYDGDNRLIEIHNADDTHIATYAYDSLGRRTQRVTSDRTFHTVWDGWQAIEEIEVAGGQDVVQSRRVYGGAGLDDVVRLEQRLGAVLESYFPLYDTIGNLIAVTDEQGEIVERYLYTPYGDRIVWVDDTPPVVEQIRLEDGAVVLEVSEPIQPRRLTELSDATLRRGADGQYFPVDVETPVTTGRQAHKRIVLRPKNPSGLLSEGDLLTLYIPAEGLLDRFGLSIGNDFDLTFAWSSSGLTILEDTTPPRVEEVCIAADRTLKVTLSEQAVLASASTALQVDGQATAWTVDASGYILTSLPLAAGSHSLELQSVALDLAGLGLAAAETHPVSATDGQIATVFATPGPNLLTESTIGNVLGFQGLPRDPESGLLYVRNRYYDPELGRFLTEDPLDYVDGPNLYQFALNNSVAYSDPMGLSTLGLGTCGTKVGNAWDDCIAERRAREKAFNDSTIGQYTNGTIQGTAYLPVEVVVTGYQAIRHPILTAKGAWYIATHPLESTAEGIVDFQMATPLERGRTVGGWVGGFGAAGAAAKTVRATRAAVSRFGDDLADVAAQGLIEGAAATISSMPPQLSQYAIAEIQRGTARTAVFQSVPRSLVAFGNRTAPRPPRPERDFNISSREDLLEPGQPPLPVGASLFSSADEAPLSGHYHQVSPGVKLPEGLGIVADGSDVIPGSPHPPGHHTLFPMRQMPFFEFEDGFRSLPWQHSGNKKKRK